MDPTPQAQLSTWGFIFPISQKEFHVPALLPVLLASLPTGPGAALAVATAAMAYVLTQRSIDASLSIR